MQAGFEALASVPAAAVAHDGSVVACRLLWMQVYPGLLGAANAHSGAAAAAA